MPRIRPDDFRELRSGYSPSVQNVVWARWWRHNDGTVSHVHYANDGSVVTAVRHDRIDGPFKPREDAA